MQNAFLRCAKVQEKFEDALKNCDDKYPPTSGEVTQCISVLKVMKDIPGFYHQDLDV